jgi:hypothetical protein
VSYPATELDRSTSGERAIDAVRLMLFLMTAVAILVRTVVTPQLLDRVYDYTGDSGAFFMKLHIGTYAILAVLPIALFGQPITLYGNEVGKFRALMRYCGLLLIIVAYSAVIGRLSSIGFIIDTYLSAGAAGLLLITLPPNLRRALGEMTVGVLVLSAAIGVVEAVTKHRFLPYDAEEIVFRPLGLTEHPLALGALCATAVGFAAVTRWPIWVRVVSIFILFIGCAASGARFSLLMAGAQIPFLLLLTPWPQLSPRHERQAKAIVFVMTLVLGAALVGVMFAGGLLSRFTTTLFDANFMVRLTIYQAFLLVTWRDLLFGISAADLVDIATKQLHLPTIESAPVAITMLLGIPLALFFVGVVVWMFVRILKGATIPLRIGMAVFVLASLSNNAFSSKTPLVVYAVVMVLGATAARRPAPQSAAGVSGAAA